MQDGTQLPLPLKVFFTKVTMGSTSSVTEVEKDVSCTASLFSLFLMKRKGCTIWDVQALSMTFEISEFTSGCCISFHLDDDSKEQSSQISTVCDHSS